VTENQVFFDTELQKYVKIVKEEICAPGENLCNECPYRNTQAEKCHKWHAGRCFDYYTYRLANEREIETYKGAQMI
jgi:hypothetical protein